jgi:hypothetical protein
MRELSVAEQRYQAVLAVIKDGRTVTEVRPRPARINVYRPESGHYRAVHTHADRRPPGQ